MATRRLKVKAMDAALVAGVKIDNVERFCREHGVRTRTFYRHRARVAAEGQWHEHSRRPHTSPAQAQPELDAWICKLRADLGVDNGADFIGVALRGVHAKTSPAWRVPARSTINRVLRRHNLLAVNPAKRPRSSWRRFSFAQPRDCYQIDATEVKLAGGGKAVIFDVLDDCTRQLVACHAAPSETAQAAVAAITKAINAYGAPALVLSDNGAAFTHRLIHPDGAPSRFARAVTAWGTRLIHSSPYHPQTCGKVERHHQTLKKWLDAQPPATNLRALQRLLETYRDYYNGHRPHSALPGRITPHQAWLQAPALGGPSHLPIQADASVHRCPVYDTGTIGVGKHRIRIGRAYHGIILTAIRDGDHATVYNPDGSPLGHAYLEAGKNYVPLIRLQDR
jgi:transposase InsO family protein